MHIFADDAQGLRRGEGNVAAYLRLHDLFGAKAEGGGVGIAPLLLEGFPADGAAVQAWRRPRLETARPQAQGAQRLAEQN